MGELQSLFSHFSYLYIDKHDNTVRIKMQITIIRLLFSEFEKLKTQSKIIGKKHRECNHRIMHALERERERERERAA